MSRNLQVLSNFVWELRFLSMAAQTAHWRVFGPSSYSDHLLFGMVYEKLDALLDPLAERLTAFSEFDDERYVDPVQQAKYVFLRMNKLGPELRSALLEASHTATFFYEHLLHLTTNIRSLSSKIRTDGFLTYGLDDLLASTASELEKLVYFLERRSQQNAGTPSPLPGLESPGAPLPCSAMPPPPPALVFGPVK